ncbi:MAG: nickel pincer cofactor biosynthesis protein LarB [Gemmatimonadota bacterium]
MSDRLRRMLEALAAGETTPDAVARELAWLPIEEVVDGEDGEPFARLDQHRGLRQGYPEVVYAPGKTRDQLLEICARLAARGDGFLVTRVATEDGAAVAAAFEAAQHNGVARTVHLPPSEPPDADGSGPVLVVTGGTGDLPVAEEAAVTAQALGQDVERAYDVGVAGLHRILNQGDLLGRAAVVIVVAGMEGALASVVGGLVSVPVIAVPTSVGYGASFGGISALLAMLNSCAAGVTVVNIDNGFGAAYAAARICRLSARRS